MNIFKRISLHFKVAKKLRPFLNSKEKQMAVFDIVEDNASQEIKNIYGDISKLPPNKYQKEKALYESYVDRINNHNKVVELAKTLIDKWDYERTISNPHHIDKEYLEVCLDISSKLNGFKKKPENYLVFQKEVEDISNNLEEICSQFDLLNEYLKLFKLPKGEYITIQQKQIIEKKANEIVIPLFNRKKLYYVFNKHLNLDSIIEDANNSYFNEKCSNPIFDNINGRSLDKEQRKAVLTDENSVSN